MYHIFNKWHCGYMEMYANALKFWQTIRSYTQHHFRPHCSNTYVDSDTISSFISMPAVLAAMV